MELLTLCSPSSWWSSYVACVYLCSYYRETYLRSQRGWLSGIVCGLACCVRCLTLSFYSHKTPWTWGKTNYSFRRRCPGAFFSFSKPQGYVTCVPQGWLWHGSCHWWGPWGPGCCSEQGGLQFDRLSPRASSSEFRKGPHSAPLTPNPVTPGLGCHLSHWSRRVHHWHPLVIHMKTQRLYRSVLITVIGASLGTKTPVL